MLSANASSPCSSCISFSPSWSERLRWYIARISLFLSRPIERLPSGVSTRPVTTRLPAQDARTVFAKLGVRIPRVLQLGQELFDYLFVTVNLAPVSRREGNIIGIASVISPSCSAAEDRRLSNSNIKLFDSNGELGAQIQSQWGLAASSPTTDMRDEFSCRRIEKFRTMALEV